MKVLSVAIPCYNSENYMRHAVETLLVGGDDVEIIIVDDGSSDRTYEIGLELQAAHPGIVKVVHQENAGHGGAVNTGLREASGLYFSGQMLDEYSRHLEVLKPDSMADFVSEDADPVDKAKVSVAGIITSVTPKTTRKGDRMAFARQCNEYGHLLRLDAGVFVTGNLSVREDEPPKLLVSAVESLIEDGNYDAAETAGAVKKQSIPVVEQKTEAPQKATAAPRRLFLRVPDTECALYCKAKNLTELFDGSFPAFFYNAATKEYSKSPVGISLSDYVIAQLRELLGAENVILK